MLFPLIFQLYLNDLIDLPRAFGLYCFVGQMYFGIDAYANDIRLLASRLEALQRMIWISENFMDQQIRFNSTKTKERAKEDECDMEWFKHSVHLGTILSDDESMGQYIKVNRVLFIDE